MPKEKVTLTLDADNLQELRRLVGARSLSGTIDAALTSYLARMRHLRAVDEWLVDMERDHGPVPAQTLERAAQLVADWELGRNKKRRSAG